MFTKNQIECYLSDLLSIATSLERVHLYKSAKEVLKARQAIIEDSEIEIPQEEQTWQTAIKLFPY